MDTHYVLVSLVVAMALLFILFLILKNRKDRKEFETDASQSELPPEIHEDEKEKT